MKSPRVPLGNVAEFINGLAFKPEDWTDDGRKIVRIQNLTDSTKPFNRTRRAVDPKYEVSPGELLVSWSATLGVFQWPGPDAALVNQHIFRVIPDAERVTQGYLRHMLSDALMRMEGHLHGATMKHVNRKEFLATEIPLPPLPEQKRIAAILDAADALRAKRRESIEQLDSLIQATFLEMFGDPVTNPKGWATPSGSQISARITVGIVVKPASYYRPSGVPALRSLNIRPHRIDATDLVYISEADNAERLRKSRVWLNDILIVRSGQPGTAAVVTPDFNGVNAIDIIIMTPDLSRVHPVYVCCYLNSDGGKRMVGGAERGQIQKHFNVGSLNSAPIPLPPLDLQTRFASIVESIEQQKARLKTHLAELDTLFASLQSRAFNGELVV
jgi:type I restriction enzyme S subunit